MLLGSYKPLVGRKGRKSPTTYQMLLISFQKHLENQKGLPFLRSHDMNNTFHSQPFRIRPYRCSFIQKTKIEKSVKEMLDSGIIQSSNSPFATSVLLVREKDGSQGFCVEYMWLNNLKIKNKFPMPLIDELLDEFNGSKYYSKIDLQNLGIWLQLFLFFLLLFQFLLYLSVYSLFHNFLWKKWTVGGIPY